MIREPLQPGIEITPRRGEITHTVMQHAEVEADQQRIAEFGRPHEVGHGLLVLAVVRIDDAALGMQRLITRGLFDLLIEIPQRLLDAGVRPKTLMRRQEDEGQRQRRNCTIPGNVDGPRTAHPVVCAAVDRELIEYHSVDVDEFRGELEEGRIQYHRTPHRQTVAATRCYRTLGIRRLRNVRGVTEPLSGIGYSAQARIRVGFAGIAG